MERLRVQAVDIFELAQDLWGAFTLKIKGGIKTFGIFILVKKKLSKLDWKQLMLTKVHPRGILRPLMFARKNALQKSRHN